jgi:tRNA (guanine37-N1)-methyltransferase
MPHFDVITLFPSMFSALTENGVVGRAFKHGKASLRCWNPRDFVSDLHKTVDDRPYGGGPGMVMMAQPLADCLHAIRSTHNENEPRRPVIFLTPHGPLLQQAHIRQWADQSGAILLCGRYEGVDQRFIDAHVDFTYCVGDFIVSGGELPSMIFLDAWVRLLPGVLNDALSAVQESFEQDFLDCPHYTRPEIFEGQAVPQVLLSGNHGKISDWREEQSIAITQQFRPDLLK